MENFNLQIDQDQEVAIWGLGFYGMNCLDFLINSTNIKVSVIIDQKKHQIINDYLGIAVMSPEGFFSDSKNKDYVVLVTVRNGVKFDAEILRAYNINYHYFDHIYLESNCESAKEVVDLLEDDTSKLIFSTLIGNRMLMKENVVNALISRDQYFCIPEFQRRKNQLLIDCGAYVGDTFEKWLENNEGNISAYLGIDPIQVHAEKFSTRLKRLKTEYELSEANIRFITKLVADQAGSEVFHGNYGSATSRLNTQLTIENLGGISKTTNTLTTVDVTTIDEEVSIIVSEVPHIQSIFIKMDIEGGELAALSGAKDTLKKFRPLLAISIYHRIDDYIRIPLFLNRYLDSYKFAIRHHSPLADETILYCFPKEG